MADRQDGLFYQKQSPNPEMANKTYGHDPRRTSHKGDSYIKKITPGNFLSKKVAFLQISGFICYNVV
jgi:hypothetical protein